MRPFALAHHRAPSGSIHIQSSGSLGTSRAGSGRLRSPVLLEEKGIDNGQSATDLFSALPKSDHNVPAPHHIYDPRDTSKRTFFAQAMRSTANDASEDTGRKLGKEYLGLPFRLTVYTAQDHVNRNVPYLRHSWNRIDFIAIIAFWVCFILAETGVERGPSRHIGVFRALSVLRTSRLLAVTNGTTVQIIHSNFKMKR